MRLQMGTFPVRQIVFGARTTWAAGRLTVDKTAALAAVREDLRIVQADLDIATLGFCPSSWSRIPRSATRRATTPCIALRCGLGAHLMLLESKRRDRHDQRVRQDDVEGGPLDFLGRSIIVNQID